MLTKEEKKNLINKYLKQRNENYKFIEKVDATLGDCSNLTDQIFKAQELALEFCCLLIDDDIKWNGVGESWLSWYSNEDPGKRVCKIKGEKFTCETVDELLDIIDKWNGLEESEKW